LVAAAVLIRLEYSRFGLVASAIRQRDLLAETLGVDIIHYKLGVFVLGSFFAGLTGVFFAHSHQVLHSSDFGLEPMVLLVVFTVIGGAQSVWGPVVGKLFGGLHAVTGLSMTVASRTIHGLIGPNGAGKSTVFNLLTGVLPLSSGEIVFKGARVSGLRPSEICRRGIARTFQATTLFRESTVLENVILAFHLHAATT